MSTALQIAAKAYSKANMDQTLSSFSMTEWPYSIAMDLLNEVIAEMNNFGNLYFLETATALTYASNTYSYTLSSYSIDPRRIIRLRRTATNIGNLHFMNHEAFQGVYRGESTITTGTPEYWTLFGSTLETNVSQDQDYSLKVYHYKDMPAIAATSDTLLVPERDEYVVVEGVYALLLQVIGRQDFTTAYSLFQSKCSQLRAASDKSSFAPRVMPAAF